MASTEQSRIIGGKKIEDTLVRFVSLYEKCFSFVVSTPSGAIYETNTRRIIDEERNSNGF